MFPVVLLAQLVGQEPLSLSRGIRAERIAVSAGQELYQAPASQWRDCLLRMKIDPFFPAFDLSENADVRSSPRAPLRTYDSS